MSYSIDTDLLIICILCLGGHYMAICTVTVFRPTLQLLFLETVYYR